jgi:hypothetical protein
VYLSNEAVAVAAVLLILLLELVVLVVVALDQKIDKMLRLVKQTLEVAAVELVERTMLVLQQAVLVVLV